MDASYSSDYSILKGVEKVFAKMLGHQRYKQRAKERTEKRKHDEEPKSVDELVRIDLVRSQND